MFHYKDFHSHVVTCIKLISFLLAFGLLSSIFLLSKTIEPSRGILGKANDLRNDANGLGATNPITVGTSENDDKFKVYVKNAFPVKSHPQRYIGQDLDANIELISGRKIRVISDFVDFRLDRSAATMIENVIITTDTGYRLTTEKLDTRFDTIFAESYKPVAGTGPIGNFTSNRMLLTYDDVTGDANLLLKGNVKVIYQPHAFEE